MKKTTALTTLLAASLLSGAAVTGATAADGDTSVTIGSPKPLSAGAKAPFDAPGVKAIRQGKAIPSGYVLVGRKVSVDAGTGAAGAAIRLSCPAGKTLRTLGGPVQTTTRGYVGQKQTTVIVFGAGGRTVSSTAYAVCR